MLQTSSASCYIMEFLKRPQSELIEVSIYFSNVQAHANIDNES